MIHVLPPFTANQIAAGEVVQRPASVVKELLENAVDAGATEISLTVADAGRTLIQVTDNGSGIAAEEAPLAFERHATSKIQQIEDLQNLSSFGFRGEALASIAAVAQVKLLTRTSQAATGTELHIAGSEILSCSEAVCAPGTSLAVRNLFYNVPARRKFLKSDAAEFKQIYNEFMRVALIRTDRSFSLSHNGKTLYTAPACADMLPRICQLLGREMNQELVPLATQTPLVKISGYIGKPEDARRTPGYQYFFVNRRYFRSSYLNKAVLNAYQNLLPEGRYPSYFITLEMDPASVDVNIHPTKTEVKFEDEAIVFQILQAVVKETLGKNALAPSIDFDMEGAPEFTPLGRNERVRPPKIDYDPLFNPFDFTGPGAATLNPPLDTAPLDTAPLDSTWVSDYNQMMPPQAQEAAMLEEGEAPLAGEAERRCLMVKGKYLLTPVKSGVMLLHIGRALERIWYEHYQALLDPVRLVPQQLLYPVDLALQPYQFLLLQERAAALKALGFVWEELPESGLRLTAVPPEHSSKDEDIVESLCYLIDIGQEDFAAQLAVPHEALCLLLARRKARDPQVPNEREASALIDKLFACSVPQTAPFGKKCFTIRSLEQLERLFD